MQGCLNTSFPAGSSFVVQFLVFDTSFPKNNVSIERFITIVKPCEVSGRLHHTTTQRQH
jgi:hypothetical protein